MNADDKIKLLELAEKWRRQAHADRQYPSDYARGAADAWEAATEELKWVLNQ